MSEINRYELEVEGDMAPYMSQHPCGDYIRYEDHKELMDAKDTLIQLYNNELEYLRRNKANRSMGIWKDIM